MPEKHSSGSGVSITYGQLPELDESESQDLEVLSRRDAQLKLESISAEDVITVRATSFSSGMALGSTPLNLLVIETLPSDIRESLSAEAGIDVDDYEVIQIGRADREYPDRSLSEYSE